MLTYAKAIGANTDFLTAQAFVFPHPQKPNQLLVIVLSGMAEDGFTKVRAVGLDCRDLFFESESSVADRFDKVLNFIKLKLPEFEQLIGVISFFEDNSLYLQTITNFDTFLLRQGSVVNLTQGIESEKLISGLLERGDKLLFLNPPMSDFEQNNWQGQLQENLLKSTPENLEFEVEAFLQQLPKSDPIAAVLVENSAEIAEVSEDSDPPLTTSLWGQSEQSGEGVSKFRWPQIQLPDLRAWFFKLGFRKLLILMVIILVGLVAVGNFWQKQRSQDKLFTASIVQAQQNLDKAVGLKDSDQAQARQALDQARNSLKQALGIKPKDAQALALQKKVQDQSYLILKQYPVSDFPIFLDLSLIKSGFTTSRLSYSIGKLAMLDKGSKTLISLSLDQKLPKVLAGTLQLGDAQFASINGDNLFVFSKDKGVLVVDMGNGKVTTVAKSDPDWQRIADIYGFAGNVYLLDEFKNQIWKYIATDKGFSQKNSYLKVGTGADFAGAKLLQIDGAVWVLKGENKLLKFIQGGEDFFAFQGFDQDLTSIKSFFTSDDTNNIYFLDNDNSRVVLTKKNGQYVGEYKGDKFKTADDLVVDEKGKKLYLLESNKIYQIELK